MVRSLGAVRAHFISGYHHGKQMVWFMRQRRSEFVELSKKRTRTGGWRCRRRGCPCSSLRSSPADRGRHRPAWRDFFDRYDARLVTTVMCSWDTNWMRAIDPAVSGLRAERTSLLALGDDDCRFAVLETDDPLAGYTDNLGQRFVGKQESG